MQKYNAEWKNEGVDFRLFSGVKFDILEDGKLDHPDDVLSQIDYVAAEVHAMTRWRGRDESQNTEDLFEMSRTSCYNCVRTPYRSNFTRQRWL